MNSLENDLCRAIFSIPFLCAAVLQYLILQNGGFESELYRMSVPLVCTFPYTCAWLSEYNSGFTKLALPRTTVTGYIFGKYFACIAAGGLSELLSAVIYTSFKTEETFPENWLLILLCSAFWAGIAALLAAVTGSRYSAYGGSFVICYFLVILHERYWESCYFINPYEWLTPQNEWFMGETGIQIMLMGLIIVTGLCYAIVLERRLEND